MPALHSHLGTCICRSTLLKAIGLGLVVGFPTNLRALYVDQLEVTEECSSVLEVVMNADKEVLTWRRQAQLLQVLIPEFYSPQSRPSPDLHETTSIKQSVAVLPATQR